MKQDAVVREISDAGQSRAVAIAYVAARPDDALI
jgi:hypothetical protein